MNNTIQIKSLFDVIKDEIIENILSYENTYASDLQYEMYNQDYYIIWIYETKEFLKLYLDDMLDALEYYKDNFWEQYPDITNPESLVSLTVLFVAWQVLNKSETLSDHWNDKLSLDELKKIQKELQQL